MEWTAKKNKKKNSPSIPPLFNLFHYLCQNKKNNHNMKKILFFVLILFATKTVTAQNIISEKSVMVTYFKSADCTDAATSSEILFWAVSSVPNTDSGQIEIVATPFNRQRCPIVLERINGIYVKNPFNTPTDKVVIVTSKGQTVTFSSYITDME